MGFLDDLLGIKNVVNADGTILPRRHAISFEGATVEDDPVNQQTRVRFGGSSGGGGEPGEPVTVEVEVTDGAVITQDGLNIAELVRLTAAGPVSVVGISTTGLEVRRKMLCNVSIQPITLAMGGTGDSQFLLPADADITLGGNGAVEVLWMPANGPSPAGWRVV